MKQEKCVRQMGMHVLSVLISLSLLAGCVSVQKTSKVAPAGVTIQGSPGTPSEHVHVSNFGYYLFNCIPLFCGSTTADSRGETVWFSNEVTLSRVQSVMLEEVRNRKCQLTEVQPYARSTCFFSAIPYVGTTFGIVWFKEVQMSAVLVRPDAPATPKGGAK
jgi:hypothetical protein